MIKRLILRTRKKNHNMKYKYYVCVMTQQGSLSPKLKCKLSIKVCFKTCLKSALFSQKHCEADTTVYIFVIVIAILAVPATFNLENHKIQLCIIRKPQYGSHTRSEVKVNNTVSVTLRMFLWHWKQLPSPFYEIWASTFT